MASDIACEVEVVEVTADEGRDLFDQVAQREMGITGAEFLKRWDAGEWADIDMDTVSGLVEVWSALPFAR